MIAALFTSVLSSPPPPPPPPPSSPCNPTSVSGLDASRTAVHEALNSPTAPGIEIVVGKGPHLWWNEVPSHPPPGGVKGDAYQALVGDVITFHFNADNNVYLMQTETDYTNCVFGSSTMLGSQNLGCAGADYAAAGLVNQYSAVLKENGTFYFSCQRGGQSLCDHCHFGQKIKVQVSPVPAGGRRHPPSAPPPTGCAEALRCKCDCCNAAECPGWPGSRHVYTHHTFHTGSAAECNAAECAARFDECPAPGSMDAPTNANSPGRIRATLDTSSACSPPPPVPPPPPSPPTSPSPAGPATVQEEFPPWALGVLGASVAVALGCTCFLMYVYRREKKGQPIWTNLTPVESSTAGSGRVCNAAAAATPTATASTAARSGGDVEVGAVKGGPPEGKVGAIKADD